MGKLFDLLRPEQILFIQKQPLFFVATAPKEGKINLSPKGLDSLRVLNPNRIQWLNLTGSGNETAAHLLEDARMTLLFCSFDEKPLRLQIYGTATTIYPDDAEWKTAYTQFPDNVGARQIINLKIDQVQTSCGFGIPHMKLVSERNTLNQWAESKGAEGITQYQLDKNSISLDGKPTR